MQAAFMVAFFSFSYLVKKNPPHNSTYKNAIFKIILLSILQFICVLYGQLIPWAIDTFPLSNVEAVLFTLFAGTNEGAEEFVISSVLDKVIIPAIKIYCTLQLIQIAFVAAMKRQKIGVRFALWKISFSLCANRFKYLFLQLQKGTTVFLALYCVVLSLILPGIILSAPFKALFQAPVDSELYHNHFAHPDSLKLQPPENPKNLIVIMLESMETNFEHHTPEIAELQRNNTNFTPGGVSVAGTSWTIAGITGKLCGIPLNMPMGINEHLGKLPTYLPGAKCLMDILNKYGYKQLFIQGSDGNFTQINKFCGVHGMVELHDLEYYRKKSLIPKDYNVFWGLKTEKFINSPKKI